MKPPSKAQKDRIKQSVRSDLQTICHSWPAIVEDARSRGYRTDSRPTGRRSPQPGSMAPTSAFQFDPIGLEKSTWSLLGWLTSASAGSMPAGPFDPMGRLEEFIAVVDRLIDLWPDGTERLLGRISAEATLQSADGRPCVDCRGPVTAGWGAKKPLAGRCCRDYFRWKRATTTPASKQAP